jgi:RNA polymerase sigma factor (TIGR02999 family)
VADGEKSIGDVTRLIRAHREGSAEAGDRLFALLYDELKRLAAAFFRSQRPDHTLQPTALVHEAFLRLAGTDAGRWEGRSHVMGVAARAMRSVLADHARRNLAGKRKGRRDRVPLSAVGDDTPTISFDALDVAQALEELSELSPRQARIVELRFFCGLEAAEVAEVLGVSERTVHGDWRLARARLRKHLEGCE